MRRVWQVLALTGVLLVPGGIFADQKDGDKKRRERSNREYRDGGYYGPAYPRNSESEKEWRKDQKERAKDRREAMREAAKDRREARREWEKDQREAAREYRKDNRDRTYRYGR